jgi:hypothetical protein
MKIGNVDAVGMLWKMDALRKNFLNFAVEKKEIRWLD